MITVSLLEPYWRTTFEKELSKLGLKKCKSQDPKYNTFKHGTRRFQFNEDYSWIDITNLQQALVANKFERMFDDNAFSNYISELNAKKNNTRENLNAIKFSQEFFSIQIHGLISSIHSSVSDSIVFTSNKDMMRIEFNLYRMNVSLRHTTRKKISDIVNLDYMEEEWELIIHSPADIPTKNWYKSNLVLKHEDTLRNILLLLSQESIKELAESNLSEMKTLEGMIKDNEKTIQWYVSENEKYTLDSSKLDLEIAMKMKELYETFRHRPSENKSRKSIPTGEEGIPKT